MLELVSLLIGLMYHIMKENSPVQLVFDQNSLVVTIEIGYKVSQIPLFIKNIPMKLQRLTLMFNMRYGGLPNQ